jgi:hypothetical protein
LFVYLSELTLGRVKSKQDIDKKSTFVLLLELVLILWIFSLIFCLIQWIISMLPMIPLPQELQLIENIIDTSGNWVFIYVLLSSTINLQDRLIVLYNRLQNTDYPLTYTTLRKWMLLTRDTKDDIDTKDSKTL